MWELSLKHQKSTQNARNFAHFPPEKQTLKKEGNKEGTIKENDEVAREQEDIKENSGEKTIPDKKKKEKET